LINKDLKDDYWKGISKDYSEFRERFLNKKSEKRYIDYKSAKKNNLIIDFNKYKPWFLIN